MNIEKIKNYNQKVLAILVTVIVLLAIVGLIAASYFAITEIRRYLRYNAQEEGILSEEEIEKLQKENLRQQIISYEIPKLVDSLNMIYIIPVSHKSLEEPEEILGLLNMYSSSENKLDSRYFKEYYGAFNNLLVYDFKKQNIKKLFDDRVNFENISIEYFEDDILILFLASYKDTYKDGVINLEDYKSLYIYSIKENKLRKIESENDDLWHYRFVDNSKDILIQVGIDKNQDGKFEVFREPSKLKLYHYQTEELTDIVNSEIHDILQKTLEGTKK